MTSSAFIHSAVLFLLCTVVGNAAEPARLYRTNQVEGWTVMVNRNLDTSEQATTDHAFDLLRVQLQEIVRVVPAPAVSRLREVRLWFSPEYPGIPPRAEYHPGTDWLREHGRNPAMAKGVEFTNIRIFAAETRRMPNFTLHELAHSYHDRVLRDGFENQPIRLAYTKAKAGGTYDRVQRRDADGNLRWDRAYAMTDPMEYFAESTEAFFSRNDFFPFDRAELERHDPEMARLLTELWRVGR